MMFEILTHILDTLTYRLTSPMRNFARLMAQSPTTLPQNLSSEGSGLETRVLNTLLSIIMV